MNEIPTPETDAKTFDPYPWNQNGPGRSHCPEVMYPCDDGEWVKAEDSRDLDRRLPVARQALQASLDAGGNFSALLTDQHEARKALTLTAAQRAEAFGLTLNLWSA